MYRKLLSCSGLLVFWLGAALSCEPAPQPIAARAQVEARGQQEDVQAIRETGQKFLTAIRAGDLESLLDCFAPDAIIIPVEEPEVKGREAIRVVYRSLFEQFKIEDIGVWEEEVVVSGDLAFSRGSAKVVGKIRQTGQTVQAHQRGLEIWRRQPDGSWKVSRAISNRLFPNRILPPVEASRR